MSPPPLIMVCHFTDVFGSPQKTNNNEPFQPLTCHFYCWKLGVFYFYYFLYHKIIKFRGKKINAYISKFVH